ncbi:MAG: endolytic transglycosylase MltG [Candidatus Ancillula sp.]|jgi:UPF0755 protein|nr:endolytic transglycosylase MltG [Candidatus Ancillula sp.]
MNDNSELFPLDRDGEVERIVKGAHARKKQKSHKSIFAVFIVLFLILSVGGAYTIYTNLQGGKDYTGNASDSLDKVNITIPQGATVSKIAQILLDNDVIASTKSFIKASDDNPQKVLSYGTYVLKKHLNAKNAFEMLLDKNNLLKIKFTIPEGYTTKQIVETIKKDPNVIATDIDAAYANIANYLPLEANGKVEGWLFPASYDFDYNITADEIFKFMINKTVEILKKHSVTPDNYESIITKASIIQREVRHKDDMPKVSNVIDNRLNINMPLGMDSIVSYGLNGGESNSLEINQSDLDDPNAPYNSRIKTGLPPTPISSPGEDAISAAVSPDDGSWLYFCTTNPDTGETEFSTTEKEFNASKAKYKQWLSAQ